MTETGAAQAPSLRDRKKQRTRVLLHETALRLFLERGFDAVTLDDLGEAAEVSKRTFFRYFAAKETVALAAETQLWEAYLRRLSEREFGGSVLAVLRDTLIDTIRAMGDEWLRRFLATRGLIARTPALRAASDAAGIQTQYRVVEVLDTALGGGGLPGRLLAEITLAAWRCAARDWVRGDKSRAGGAKVEGLIGHLDDAFAALPAALDLRAPEPVGVTPPHRDRR
ncbi:TetR family transcriptional regulator [Actinocatenispora thailandica]|uniref:TetR family transcriptional regulator n=1 Tax=Actinocatenispora thailandica TaxID=227318 RepID=A0A7R7DMF1_9ACTN|nr:TetR family transcriptional regulator [Actinocatenispora thailandica]BCJ34186.1 TetR family transcriptional regulator [Actinocatenispora thailandica]